MKIRAERKKEPMKIVCITLVAFRKLFFYKNTFSFFTKKKTCAKRKNTVFSRNPFLTAKRVYLPLLFVLLFILALTAMCTTVSATECGCQDVTGVEYHDTIRGGIYFTTDVGDAGFCKKKAMTVNFTDVPEGIKLARVYTGVWAGTPGCGGWFNITINGNSSTDYCSCDPDTPEETERCLVITEPECRCEVTGCGVHFITYNATGNITAGNNTVKMQTWDDRDGCCSPWDGRIYCIALLVLYENESMPEITYWIDEETRFVRNVPPSYVCDEINIYFNETIYPGSVSDFKYWAMGYPHVALQSKKPPELNGKEIGPYDYVESGAGKGISAGYDTLYRWDNIPPGYLKPSNNLFYYYQPEEGGEVWDRVLTSVIMLNSSGPANLTVTNISPQSLYADPSESGRYANVINATVVNYGKIAYLFNVTLYANDTKVDVKRITNLGEGESINISFLWAPNATDTYELNVTADIENIVKETDETNNSKTLNVTVTEAPSPAWQSLSSNVTQIPNGGTIELRAQGKAETGLHNATLATNETGDWKNCTNYGSPMDMFSCYNYSFTHTSDADWNNQTIDTFLEKGYTKPTLIVSGGDVKLNQITGSDNVACKKNNGSSSHYGTYTPDKANDGDEHSFWFTRYPAQFPEWWWVDLGEEKAIKKILVWLYGAYGPYHYAVFTSNDNETWTLKTEQGAGNDKETYTNLDWSCRYINVTIYDAYGGEPLAGIYEFEAYAAGNYTPNGTLTSSTIKTSNPVVVVIPTWNSTEPAGTNLSVSISVDNGATWKNATNGTELTWNYNVYNTGLKYKVLFNTSNLSRTPVLHDIRLNYTTKDPVESEWLWSNFTWQNASVTDKTVGWKIYYEDMLGQTNCTGVKTFDVGEGVANVFVTTHTTSFGNMLAGDNTTIYISLTLNNSEGTAAAKIYAVFKTNVSEIYGLNGTGAHIIPGNNFELGPDTNEKALANTTTKTFISTLLAGENVTYNAILIVPAGQAADDYSGIVELSW